MFRVLSTLLVVISSLVTDVQGTVTVTGDAGLAIPMVNNYNIEALGNGHFNVTVFGLYNPFGNTFYEIHGNANDTVDNLIIDVDGPPAGSPVIVRVLDVGSVINILQTGTGETLLNVVQVNNDIGSITVEAIGSLTAGRDVTGNIVATTSDNPIRGITAVIAGNLQPGSILGDLSAVNGRIGFLSVLNGSIGTAANPVTLECKYTISQLFAESVHADINTRANNGPGVITAIRAGELHGSITTNDLGPSSTAYLHVAEDFTAIVSIAGSFSGASKKIQVPEDNFSGQIIFNADNNPTPVWDAPVHIIQPDPTDPLNEALATIIDTLAPSYTNTAASLGAGSVGLAPFALHDESSSPVNGFVWPQAGQGPVTEVRLRHYGPITFNPAFNPVTITRKFVKCSPPGASSSDLASQFSFADSDADNSLVITGPFKYGFEYTISPTAELKSFQVSGEPAVAWDGDYVITLDHGLSNCTADTDGDRDVGIVDFLAVLADWGMTESAADADCDGNVGILDFLDVLARWGPCPPAASAPDYNSQQAPSLALAEGSYGPVSDKWVTVLEGSPRPRWETHHRYAADGFTAFEDDSITMVHWWGFYEDQGADCRAGYTDSFTISYYRSATHPVTGYQVPGALHASFSSGPGLSVNRYDAEVTVGPNDIPVYLYTAAHDEVEILEGECYWIEIKNNGGDETGALGCHWRWAWSAQGDPQYSAQRPAGASSYTAAGDPDNDMNLAYGLDSKFDAIVPQFGCFEQ